MANDGEHQMRRQLDVRLAQLVEDLQTSPELQARGDRLAAELLEQPELRAWVAELWTEAKTTLRTQADDPGSPLRAQIADAVTAAGRRMLAEPALAAKVDEAADAGAHYVVEHFGRSEEHTSELQSLMRISYAVFCLKKKKTTKG